MSIRLQILISGSEKLIVHNHALGIDDGLRSSPYLNMHRHN